VEDRDFGTSVPVTMLDDEATIGRIAAWFARRRGKSANTTASMGHADFGDA
jgi:hypothetical protein